jgi:hypothetical protein
LLHLITHLPPSFTVHDVLVFLTMMVQEVVRARAGPANKTAVTTAVA